MLSLWTQTWVENIQVTEIAQNGQDLDSTPTPTTLYLTVLMDLSFFGFIYEFRSLSTAKFQSKPIPSYFGLTLLLCFMGVRPPFCPNS